MERGQLSQGVLLWIIIGITVLVLSLAGYGIINGNLSGIGDFIENFFKFGAE